MSPSGTENWLSRIQKVFEDRTKGEWRAVPSADYYSKPNCIFDEEARTLAGYVENNDAPFIALCGTIGTELLEVVKAAEDIYKEGDEEDSLRDALAALKAKVEGMK